MFSFGTTNNQQQGTSSFGFGSTSNQPLSTGFSGFGQPMKVVQMEQTGNSFSQSTEDCFDKKDSFGGLGCFVSVIPEANGVDYNEKKEKMDQEMIKEYFGMMMKGELNDIRVWMDNTNVMNPTFCIDLKKNVITINENSTEIYPGTIRKEYKDRREFLTIIFEGGEKNVVKFHLERRKKINPNQLRTFCSGDNEIMRYVYAYVNGYVIANGKALVIDVR